MKYPNQKKQIIEQLKQSRHIIIVTHRNPDGDAIGSALAMSLFAKSIGKKATILLTDPVPNNLLFLHGAKEVEVYDKAKHFETFLFCDTIFILDLNAKKRLGILEEAVLASSAKKIMIDHHQAPEGFADLYYSVPEVISTCNLVYDIVAGFDTPIAQNVAEALYVGIITDSGNFRFSGTDPNTHIIAAKLLEAGANQAYLYDKVYNENRLEAIHILGEAFRSLTLYLDGKLAVMLITSDMFNRCGAKNDDVDSFAEKTLAVQGVVAGVLLSDMDSKEEVRISMRSKDGFSVRDVAVKIGGGGHINASGAREFNLDIYQTRDYLIDIFEQEMVRQGIIGVKAKS